ncbi:hypothetical protein Ahy_Scaffold6g107956 [Arachis hypogaea]|uniref:Uncharacterized protein n=1 Tax=Arachis hypogaea TaxID=3818 RepID=A0A444WPS0_ARAHY|nr:hypothetical protein Ahy_Scaffold6g107956 [Arachis hypogaea]
MNASKRGRPRVSSPLSMGPRAASLSSARGGRRELEEQDESFCLRCFGPLRKGRCCLCASRLPTSTEKRSCGRVTAIWRTMLGHRCDFRDHRRSSGLSFSHLRPCCRCRKTAVVVHGAMRSSAAVAHQRRGREIGKREMNRGRRKHVTENGRCLRRYTSSSLLLGLLRGVPSPSNLFPEVRTPELLAKLVDVVSSSGGSNRNATTIAAVADSSSRPAVASSSAPVYEPPIQPVASPSFAVDLSGNVGDEVRYGEHIPTEMTMTWSRI